MRSAGSTSCWAFSAKTGHRRCSSPWASLRSWRRSDSPRGRESRGHAFPRPTTERPHLHRQNSPPPRTPGGCSSWPPARRRSATPPSGRNTSCLRPFTSRGAPWLGSLPRRPSRRPRRERRSRHRWASCLDFPSPRPRNRRDPVPPGRSERRAPSVPGRPRRRHPTPRRHQLRLRRQRQPDHQRKPHHQLPRRASPAFYRTSGGSRRSGARPGAG